MIQFLFLSDSTPPFLPSLGSSSTQVIVYTVYKYKTVKRTHTLELSDRIDGKFALNIVDNLIIVHHKSSRTSMVFDIQLSNDSTSGGIISYKLPVCEGRPIRSLENYETYSSNWVMFEPDIIIDVKKGEFFGALFLGLAPMTNY